MKIHGSIEAPSCSCFLRSFFCVFPWMKIHGSIEANCCRRDRGQLAVFPWMKIHGSIEAFLLILGRIGGIVYFHEWKFMTPLKPNNNKPYMYMGGTISMNENSWLHWSQAQEEEMTYITVKFPWMKIHGSIEAWRVHEPIQKRPSNFHEWKFMAPFCRFSKKAIQGLIFSIRIIGIQFVLPRSVTYNGNLGSDSL